MSRFPILAVLAPILASCAAMPAGAPIPVNGLTLSDDYLLVHGVAAGALSVPGTTIATINTMIRLDRSALLALARSEETPGSLAAKADAQAAIARLADYATAVGAGKLAPKPDRLSGAS